ncbi:COG3014 family protein [Roseateles sp.]|uniref:COG3014 family protein n=1 Tax=Roseateles sp. TaxID=1971397 RepID=UPI0039299454
MPTTTSRLRLLGALVIVALLTGCAATQSHDKHAESVQQAARSGGGFAAALAQHEASATSDDQKKALLYNLERGELLALNRRYADSIEALALADVKVKEWEEAAKTSPDKLLGTLGAATISERLKPYEGQDYEKVFLTTRLALNRLVLGDLDNARVEIKRTHEREAVIAEFRAKETAKAEAEAKEKGADAKGKELNGYPVETLNDPAVLKLKNGYQNALSHYLSGFVYEVLGEDGLAAPGYRKAIELRPEVPLLEEGLRGLDQRTSFTHKRRQAKTDVLLIVEAGTSPARKPKAFTVPVPISGRLNSVSISYPVIEPNKEPLLTGLTLGGAEFKLEPVVDVDLMARRALSDEMPGMVLRGITRAIVKGTVQNELQKRAGLFGAVVGLAASVVTEQADDRMWRMLPGRVYLARAYLEPGEHRLVFNGQPVGEPVKIDGQYAVLNMRLFEGQWVMHDVAKFGRLVAPPPAAAAPAATTAVVSGKVEAPAAVAPKPAAKPAVKPAAPAAAKPAAAAAKPAAAPAVVPKPN